MNMGNVLDKDGVSKNSLKNSKELRRFLLTQIRGLRNLAVGVVLIDVDKPGGKMINSKNRNKVVEVDGC